MAAIRATADAMIDPILSSDDAYRSRFDGSSYRPTSNGNAVPHSANNSVALRQGSASGTVAPTDYEANAREAGRRLAKQVPKAQYMQLVAEHQKFAMADLSGTISSSERRSWQLVKWQIEQIEDALHGEDIDRLGNGCPRTTLRTTRP